MCVSVCGVCVWVSVCSEVFYNDGRAATNERFAIAEEPVGVWHVSGGTEMRTEFWWEKLLPETIGNMGGKY